MDTRREFIKKSILLSGAAGLSAFMPASVQRAFAIDPEPGTTYLDAEHIVILMQENRSFDHCFGMLQGVRGFNDPRAITLPDKKPVWLQTNAAGETYAPFRFNIKDTKITWMGSIPHSRSSQVDAYNDGKYDQWLNAKRSGHKKYADMPLTLGHYTREDLPFNYALADAFTVCDQHFCSAMTSTWPNRLFLWTGTVREEQKGGSKAHMRNDLAYGEAKWKTFPERLEENGVSWNVYQNDISCGGGFVGEERAWLANFGCNLLEQFEQYHVKFSSRFVQGLQRQSQILPQEIKELEEKLASLTKGSKQFKKIGDQINKKREVLANVQADLAKWSMDNYEKLSAFEKNLYQKAFSKNDGDPFYHQITTLNYRDGDKEREVTVPKGDVLYQFREDVNNGKLPTVSWLVGPENFSDHPTAPWYGAWYVSEILDILTKNPEVWKKTIFILTYDENDGYFDHIPPFTPPDLNQPGTGKCSEGIDTEIEFIRRENEIRDGIAPKQARDGAIGLGYRVPLIIASPWSRGGKVCSQVFDHTSCLQFMEEFLNKKFGLNIKETNISQWRRTVCGDLTAAFSPYRGEKFKNLPFLNREHFIETIHKAQFKKEPSDYKKLTAEEIEQIKKDPSSSPFMPVQEPGIRTSCALPYQLYADGKLSADGKKFEIKLEAGNELFGNRSQGSPFRIYAPVNYLDKKQAKNTEAETGRSWCYAVTAGDSLTDEWPLASFENNKYHLQVYGPNGFYREFTGNTNDPLLEISCEYERKDVSRKKLSGNMVLKVINTGQKPYSIEIIDNSYGKSPVKKQIEAAGSSKSEAFVALDLSKDFGWYDLSVRVSGFENFEKRYAGRVETGKDTFSDPAMGKAVKAG